jgi:hypothetical protein
MEESEVDTEWSRASAKNIWATLLLLWFRRPSSIIITIIDKSSHGTGLRQAPLVS